MLPSIASERFEEIVKAADPVAKILGIASRSRPTQTTPGSATAR
jgi:hypothetical protein